MALPEIDETPSDIPNTNVTPPDIALRPFVMSDVEDYMVWASDDRVSQYCGWDAILCKEKALKRLADHIAEPWYRAICLKGRPIGCIFVRQGRGDDRCKAEIGYTLAAKYWGQGIATQAVKKVISSIFKDLPDLERLEALIDVENVGSQKVVKKAGFLKEGVLRKSWILKGRTRDMAVYSFLKTDTILDM